MDMLCECVHMAHPHFSALVQVITHLIHFLDPFLGEGTRSLSTREGKLEIKARGELWADLHFPLHHVINRKKIWISPSQAHSISRFIYFLLM